MNENSRGAFHLSRSLFIQQPAKRENWQLRNSVIFISCKIAVIRDAEHPKVTRNFKVSGSHCVPESEPTEISFMHKLVERVWLVTTSYLTSATQGGESKEGWLYVFTALLSILRTKPSPQALRKFPQVTIP